MKTILIVDDSSTARIFIKRCLEIAGLRGSNFLEASDGNKALEIIAREPIDIVFSDLNMPNMDGKQLLKEIKWGKGGTDIPVFIVSSASSPAKEIELIAAGAEAVISKPISPASIIPKLKKINFC